jgi:hypothetical protein
VDIPNRSDILERRRIKNAKHVEALTERCASALESRYDGRSPVWVDIDGFNNFIVEEVMKQFQKKGWTVRTQHDQRDGSTLVFE